MKPSEKRIKVIEFLEQQLKFWKHTDYVEKLNFICDISEFSSNMDNVLSEGEIKDLDILTTELYLSITEIG